MRILVAGNLGYVGPVVVQHLHRCWPDAELIGYDTGFFAHCLAGVRRLPETFLTQQFYGDLRRFPEALLRGIDAVINLAAISNDPMGNQFETQTLEINHSAGIKLARFAMQAGVRAFIFASSCSVYGCAEDGARREDSTLEPLTAYARSKVLSERDLSTLASDTFQVTCLRFATACGWSDRLRLDLVLNDFVASALVNRKVTILSDGTPWRPLIHVDDMARAMEWAIQRPSEVGGNFLVLNTGSNRWNFQVKDLGEAVAREFGNVEVSINKGAAPDRRSYQVDFSRFEKLAPGHQPQVTLSGAVAGLKEGLENMGFRDPRFRESEFIRLNALRAHLAGGRLTSDLSWHS